MNHSEIEVTFYDAETGNAFAGATIPINQLPVSFEARTTLNLGDEEWEVVEARPVTSQEFSQSGKLDLLMRKLIIGYAPAKNILYTLPTISKDIPPIADGSSKLGKQVLELHEDEWRQIELLSHIHKNETTPHFDEIERIHNEESIAGAIYGYKEIYLRDNIQNPFGKFVKIDEIESLLPSSVFRYDGLAYEGKAGILEGGFAYRIGNLDFFGQIEDGRIGAFCLHSRIYDAPPDAIKFLENLMKVHKLYLIDWRRMYLVSPKRNGVKKYLNEVAKENQRTRKRLQDNL